MEYYLAAAVATAFVFYLGYHIGHQLGRTAHIRRHIEQARDKQIIARIDNQ